MSRDQLVVASFNLHAGIDGWGRPFDVVAACRSIDADVLVLEESWRDDDQPRSLAEEVAHQLGYEVVEVPLAAARRIALDGYSTSPRWGPRPGERHVRPIRFDGPARTRRARATSAELARPSVRGTWRLALLSRLPMRSCEVVDLPRLRRDGATRKALVAEVAVGERNFRVAGTHFAHLSHGSVLQMRALARRLAGSRIPSVLTGDFNCWTPPLRLIYPGWHETVHGRTWPAWRPHSQIDHVLTTAPQLVVGGEVLAPLGSDHRAVRTAFSLG